MPHPIITLSGLLILVVGLGLTLKTGYRPPVWLPVVFAIAFGVLSRRSARRQKAKRAKELEELRNKRVLHLED